MGGRAGGGANGGMGSASRSRFASIPGIQAIKDPQVRNELIQTLEDYDKEFGVKQTNIVLDSLRDAHGETWFEEGKSTKIILNSKTFQGSAKDIKDRIQKEMDSGWLTKSSKPIRATLAHELGHATWSSDLWSDQAMGARSDFYKAYRKFKKDTSATGWGRYSKSSYEEWVAEGVAKHLYGTKDQHTQAIVSIIKKHKL